MLLLKCSNTISLPTHICLEMNVDVGPPEWRINKCLRVRHSFSTLDCDIFISISQTERKKVPVCVTHLDIIIIFFFKKKKHPLHNSKAIRDLVCFPSRPDRTFSLAEYEKLDIPPNLWDLRSSKGLM